MAEQVCLFLLSKDVFAELSADGIIRSERKLKGFFQDIALNCERDRE
jgi:hypothetical protein